MTGSFEQRDNRVSRQLGGDAIPDVGDGLLGGAADETAGNRFQEAAEPGDVGAPVNLGAGLPGSDRESGFDLAGGADALAGQGEAQGSGLGGVDDADGDVHGAAGKGKAGADRAPGLVALRRAFDGRVRDAGNE